MGLGNMPVVLQPAEHNRRVPPDAVRKTPDCVARKIRPDPLHETREGFAGDKPPRCEFVRLDLLGISSGPSVEIIESAAFMTEHEVSHFMHEGEPEAVEPIVSKSQRHHGISTHPEDRPVKKGPWKVLDEDEPDPAIPKNAAHLDRAIVLP
jgi:hypothetical protein